MKVNGLLVASLMVAAFAMTGCGQKTSSIAKVNGLDITQTEMMEYLEAKPTVRVVVDGQPVELQVADTLGFQAMQDLVVRKLLLQMAKEEGVTPSKEDIDKEIKMRNELQTTYVKQMQARGMSMEGIRSQVELELAQQRILMKGITVTDSEVEQYIKANPQEFTDPARAEMFWILTTADKKAAVDAELAKGKKFQDVAAAMSLDPEAKASNGRFGANRFPTGVPFTELNGPIRAAVEKTAADKSTEWIQLGTANQIGKFYIVRKTESRKQEITSTRREFVKRALAVQRGSEGKSLRDEMSKRLREAEITVDDDSLKQLWSRFEEQLKKTQDVRLPGGNQ